VLASTAGLEALLFGLPLAVLEIPGVGFVHDYVSSGAALGLSWQRPLASQVNTLLDNDSANHQTATHYIQRNLAFRQGATDHVVSLISTLVGE